MTPLQMIVEKRGLRQTDIAHSVGISDGYMSQIINGDRVPRTPIALAIARALNTSVEALFGDDCPSDILHEMSSDGTDDAKERA